jgi:predicted nuclease of predicted toxin-antitoxin system
VRILIDECLPAELADELTGHEAQTVQQAGWTGIDNGELLRRAATAFDVFVTIDKKLHRQHRPPATLAVITIKARTNRIESLRPLIPELLEAIRQVQPGSFGHVGS